MNEKQVVWASVGIVLMLVAGLGIYHVMEAKNTAGGGGSGVSVASSSGNCIHHIWVPKSEKRYHQYMNKVVMNLKTSANKGGWFVYFGGTVHITLKYPDGSTKQHDVTLTKNNGYWSIWKPHWWKPWDKRYKIIVKIPDYFYLSQKGRYTLSVTYDGELNGMYAGMPAFSKPLHGHDTYRFRVK